MKNILIAGLTTLMLALPMAVVAENPAGNNTSFETVAVEKHPGIGKGPIRGTDPQRPSKGEKGDKGDTGAVGPKGDKGDTGAAGADGKDGHVVIREVNFNTSRYMNDMAATAALGGIELRDTFTGEWAVSGGIGGLMSEGSGSEAISLGVSYGVSSTSSVYGKVAHSLRGDSTTWFVGFNTLVN